MKKTSFTYHFWHIIIIILVTIVLGIAIKGMLQIVDYQNQPFVEVKKIGKEWYGDVYFTNKQGKTIRIAQSKTTENRLADTIHSANYASTEVSWTDDNRVRMIGGCEPTSTLCGIYESKNTSEPWIIEKL